MSEEYGYFVIGRVRRQDIVSPEVREREQWDARFEGFLARCIVEKVPVEGKGFVRAQERITYPDGSTETLSANQLSRRAIRDRFELIDQAPPTPSDDPVRTWAARLFLPEGERDLDIAPLVWAFGLPIEEVLKVLNDLAAQGWTLVHVSEDRGLYRGEDTDNDAYVTRARYLLRRSSGSV